MKLLDAVNKALKTINDEITEWTKRDGEKVVQPTPKAEERRLHERKTIVYEVIIMSTMKSHRTSTLDISRSGLLVKEVLPAEVCKGEVDIIICYDDPKTQKKMRLPLKGSVIGAPRPSSRMVFTPLSMDNKVRKEYEYFFEEVVTKS